jgi:uncharacterized lipoprotein YddW (UPF0748 family)
MTRTPTSTGSCFPAHGLPRRAPALLALLAAMLALRATDTAHAQTPGKHEVRAVWLTTLSGLDWPAAAERGQAARQRESLTRMLDNIARLKLNTVMFQVRSRGNAFYPSSLEPWAAELTGVLGRDPGWDPLAVAI